MSQNQPTELTKTNNPINWKGARVLVAGGAGMIGSHMARELLRRGAKVTVADNLSSGSIKNLKDIWKDIEFFQYDLRQYDCCRGMSVGKDAVFQFAADMGGIGYITAVGARIMINNSFINIQMLRATREVEHYYFSSSACVYANYLQTDPSGKSINLRECDCSPADPNEYYGWEKLYCLTGNTKVLTDLGWIPIKKVKIGDKVYTHTGYLDRVTDIMSRPYDDPILEIVVSTGHVGANGLKNIRIQCTPEHPILTETGWVEAGKLSVGTTVAVLSDACPVCGKDKVAADVTCSRSCAASMKWLDTTYREHKMEQLRNRFPDWFHNPTARLHWRRTFEKRLRSAGMHSNEVYIDALLQVMFPGEFMFTGDGKAPVRGYYPDWLNNEKKLILEYMGRPPRVPEHFQKRISAFLDAGYRVLVLTGDDFNHPRQLLSKVKHFCNREPIKTTISDRSSAEYIALLDEPLLCRDTQSPKKSIFRAIHSIKTVLYQRKGHRKVYNLSVENQQSYVAGGIVVHNCEKLVAAAQRDWGRNIRVGRFHNIYGSAFTAFDKQKGKAPCHLIIKAIRHPNPPMVLWGDGRAVRSFLYIDDCVEAVLRLMDTDHGDPINIGSDRCVSVEELAKIIIRISGKEIVPEHDITKPVGVMGRNSDNTLVRKVLGWEPKVSLEEGLAEVYAWAEKNFDELEGI